MTKKELTQTLKIFSHKLKNPIHAVMINLDVLKLKLGKKTSDKDLLKHLTIATKEVQKINEIVKKYFEYLKFDDKERKKKDLRKILG